MKESIFTSTLLTSRLLAYKNCDDLMQLPRYPIIDKWAHFIIEHLEI
jgi:hypothetical protein